MARFCAFIMDGKKLKLEEGADHNAGFLSLISVLQYCKSKPDQVQKLMDLLLEKINWLFKEEIIVNQNGVRGCFIGNFELLSEPVSDAADMVMKAIADNNRGSAFNLPGLYFKR